MRIGASHHFLLAIKKPIRSETSPEQCSPRHGNKLRLLAGVDETTWTIV